MGDCVSENYQIHDFIVLQYQEYGENTRIIDK